MFAQSKQNQLFEKKHDPNFPTPLEIEQFQSQRKHFAPHIGSEFGADKESEHAVQERAQHA